MELQFDKTTCSCLRTVVNQVQCAEQTQEVRLSDAMPDIGRVLGAWGQVMIRGKEWRGSSMVVSGGVNTWTLYLPEEGSQVKSVEAWIPFQLKWDFPQTQRDGQILVVPYLKSVDARSTSARKMIVRVNVCLWGDALEPGEETVYCADDISEDVEVLRQTYPVELPKEAGETIVQMDEDLLDQKADDIFGKILYYTMVPEILEQKVLAGRLVFRGQGNLHVLYEGPDGMPTSYDTQIPFSQYTDLDQSYSTNADGTVHMALTNLELLSESTGKLRITCAMAAQYVIYDREMLHVVQDAYSPGRKLEVKMETARLPVRLDCAVQAFTVEQFMQQPMQRVLDLCWYPEHPTSQQMGDNMEVKSLGQFRILYRDMDGNLQTGQISTENQASVCSDSDNRPKIFYRSICRPESMITADGVQLSVSGNMCCNVFAEQKLEMVEGLELGPATESDCQRPSLILRRVSDEGLWQIAKAYGSTVQAIQDANKLQDEPEKGRFLLIPIS